MLNKVRFDWFSFTIKGKSLESVMEDLGLNPVDFHLNEFSRYGYSSMIVHDVYNISILFNGTDDMGIHVVVPGGCVKYFMECFLEKNGEKTPFDSYATNHRCQYSHFAKYVLMHGKFSRVDVNIDVDSAFFSPYHMRNMVKEGNYVSLYRSWDMREYDDGSGTLYLGRRNSSNFIRIYDKAKEQGDFESILYRFEVQFNKSSDTFMLNFLEQGLGGALSAFLDRQLRFVDAGDYYAKPFPEWVSFLELVRNGEDCDYSRYEEKKRKTTIDSLFHMFNQYNNIIGDFLTVYGDLDDFIDFMFCVSSGKENNFEDLIKLFQAKGWQTSC